MSPRPDKIRNLDKKKCLPAVTNIISSGNAAHKYWSLARIHIGSWKCQVIVNVIFHISFHSRCGSYDRRASCIVANTRRIFFHETVVDRLFKHLAPPLRGRKSAQGMLRILRLPPLPFIFLKLYAVNTRKNNPLN